MEILKLKSFKPLLDEMGNHKSFHLQKFNKDLFKFILEFENGLTGEASSVKPEGNYTIGTEYEVEQSQNQYAYNGINLKVKKHDQEGFKGGYSKKDPKRDSEILALVAIETSAVFANQSIHPFDVEDMTKKYIAYLNDRIHNKRYNPISIQGCLRRAVMFVGTEAKPIGNAEAVCQYADQLYEIVKNSTWITPSSQTSQSNSVQQGTITNQAQNNPQSYPKQSMESFH